jgi:glutathione peroxidase-family protein
MKKIFFLLFTAIFIHSASFAQVKTVSDVSLINASDKSEIALSSFSAKKGIIVIFTSNYCPFSKLYEDRINDLANKYASQGIQMVLINSNSPDDNPAESIEEMAEKVRSSSFSFPYLSDKERKALDIFKASKTPEAFLLKPSVNGFDVIYSGAIDDNPQVANQVREQYLAGAIDALLGNRAPARPYVRPVGCIIKN